MKLSDDEVQYFIMQVGLSAKSFGVADADVTAVGTLLSTTFGTKCSAKATVIPDQGDQLQSICTGEGCPTAENGTCSAEESSSIASPATSTATETSPVQASSAAAAASSSASAAPNSGVETKPMGFFALAVTFVFALIL